MPTRAIHTTIAKEVLSVTVRVIFILALLSTALLILISPDQLMRTVPALEIVVIMPIVIYLLKKDHVSAAGILFITSIFLAIITGMTLNGWTIAPVYFVFFPLIAFSTFIADTKITICIIAIATALGLSSSYIFNNVFLIEYVKLNPTLFYSNIAIYMIALFLAVNVPKKMLYKALSSSEKHKNELKTINAELISAKKKIEEANQAKSNFILNMSHEVRTPLNGISGMLQILYNTKLSDEQQEYIHLAKISSERMTSMLSNIIDISKIEQNILQVSKVIFDIKEALLNCCELFLINAKLSDLAMYYEIDQNIPQQVVSDQVRIIQIVNNIIGNAFKFTTHGWIRLQAHGLGLNSNNIYHVLIIISDSGVGIPDEKMNYIFEPFSQASEGYSRNFEGVGLGLTICKELAKKLGCSLCIESEVDEGTRVYVSIPLTIPDDAAISDQQSEAITQ